MSNKSLEKLIRRQKVIAVKENVSEDELFLSNPDEPTQHLYLSTGVRTTPPLQSWMIRALTPK